MGLKTVEDLKQNIASVGGAMGSWPFRTLWFVSRWERTGQTDPNVVNALRQQNIDSLRELAEHAARNYDIDTYTLEARIDALEDATIDDFRFALNQAYENNYGDFEKCPYEREGRDIACHRCPVAAEAMDYLVDIHE